MATVGIWGAWHLGSVVAAGLSARGHNVLVTDLDDEVVRQLASGRAAVREPGLDDLIREQASTGRLLAVAPADPRLGETRFSVLAADVDVGEDDVGSLESLDRLVKALGSVLHVPTQLVVMSQVPVGTSEKLRELVSSVSGIDSISVVYMPENLRLGRALEGFFHPDRLVIGADDQASTAKALELISAIDCPRIVMSVRSAEMAKHALNAYLATSISFMSKLSDVCEAVGADAWDVAAALRSDVRISERAPITPGLGFSGGTLGRDLQYLVSACTDAGLEPDFFDSILSVNRRRLADTVDRVDRLVGGISGAHIGILGLTYKPGTSTLRRSQSLEVARRLADAGASVVAHDPSVDPTRAGELGLSLVADPYEVAAGADAILLMTPWPEYRDLDLRRLGARVRKPILFDPASFLPPQTVTGAGFRHDVVGRSGGAGRAIGEAAAAGGSVLAAPLEAPYPGEEGVLLAGKICVVTGAGRGIGRYTAETFARQGAALALCSRSPDELDEVRLAVEELGCDVLVDRVDVADAEDVARFAAGVLGRFGRVDVLVNNAGIQGPVGLVTEVDLQAWNQTVGINLLGVVHTIRAFAPAMAAAGGGRIINMSGGGLGGPSAPSRLSAYTSSKAAVLNLTETLAIELAPHRIWINALAPGAINTQIIDAVIAAGPELAGSDLYASSVRQRGGGDPIENVGEAMLFLASTRSSSLTGKLISAKWDPIHTLGDRAEGLNNRSLYTLRRVDDVAFFEVPYK